MSDYGTTKSGKPRVKPTMVHVNVRLPVWALEFYKEYPNYTKVIRDVLIAHAQENKDKAQT